MKFAVQSLSTPVQKTEETVSVESLLALSEEVHASYLDLSETEKSLEEVQQVVANIDMSIAAIEKYGEQAVQVLNVDGSLTELMGTEVLTNITAIIEKLNGTKIASIEGFGDKIKEFIAKILAFIKGFINKIRGAFSEVGNNYDTVVSLVKDSQIRNIEERIANGTFKHQRDEYKFEGGGKVTLTSIPDLRRLSFRELFVSMDKCFSWQEADALDLVKKLSEGEIDRPYMLSVMNSLLSKVDETSTSFKSSLDSDTGCTMTASELQKFYSDVKTIKGDIDTYCTKFQERLSAIDKTRNEALKCAKIHEVSMLDVDAACSRVSMLFSIEASMLDRISNKAFVTYYRLGRLASFIGATSSIVSSGQ